MRSMSFPFIITCRSMQIGVIFKLTDGKNYVMLMVKVILVSISVWHGMCKFSWCDRNLFTGTCLLLPTFVFNEYQLSTECELSGLLAFIAELMACCRRGMCGAPSWLAMVSWQGGSGQFLVWLVQLFTFCGTMLCISAACAIMLFCMSVLLSVTFMCSEGTIWPLRETICTIRY